MQFLRVEVRCAHHHDNGLMTFGLIDVKKTLPDVVRGGLAFNINEQAFIDIDTE